MDDWVFFQIPKAELKLEDERPLLKTSGGSLAYYAVDPSRNFQKFESKTEGKPGGPAEGSQPPDSQTNRISGTNGSRR